MWVSVHGYLDMIKLLLKSSADSQAIIDASWGGYLSIIKLLTDLNGDICSLDNEAIFNAKDRRHLHLTVVRFLIKKRN